MKHWQLLFIIKEIHKTKCENKNVISIDLGVRPFATCYSNIGTVKINANGYDKIKLMLKKIDNIQKNENNKQ